MLAHPFFSRAALPVPSHPSAIANQYIMVVYGPSTKYSQLSEASNPGTQTRTRPVFTAEIRARQCTLTHSVERLSCSPAPRPGRISLAKVTNNTQAKRTKVGTRVEQDMGLWQEDGEDIGPVSTIDALSGLMQVASAYVVVQRAHFEFGR